MASAYEDNLSCAVCLVLYDDPRVLPCGHSYCLKCLLDLDNKKSSNKVVIKCPICQAESSHEHGGHESFTKNYELNSLVQAFISETSTKDTTGDENVCEICDSQKPAQRACVECEMMYCEACFKTCHPMRGNIGKHKIVKPDGDFKCRKDTKTDGRNMYCVDCDILLSVSDISGHKKHDIVLLDEAHSIFKVKLAEATGDIDLMQSTLESALEKSREKLHLVDAIFEEIEVELMKTKEAVLSKLKVDVMDAEAAIDHVMSAISTHSELQSRASTISFIEECQNILRSSSLKQDFNDVRLQLDKIDSLTCKNEAVITEIKKLCLVPATELWITATVNGRESLPSASVVVPTVTLPSVQFDHQRAGSHVRVSTDGVIIAHAYFAAELLAAHHPPCEAPLRDARVVLGNPRMTAGRVYWELEAAHAARGGCGCGFGVTSSATSAARYPGGDAASWGVGLHCNNVTTTIVMRHAGKKLHRENTAPTSGHHTHRYGLLLDVDAGSLSVIDVMSNKIVYTFTNVDASGGVTPVFSLATSYLFGAYYKCTLRLVDPGEIQRATLPFPSAAV